jgi:hypothetical protein
MTNIMAAARLASGKQCLSAPADPFELGNLPDWAAV